MSPEGGGSDDESDALYSDEEEVLPYASGTRHSLDGLPNKLDADEDHKGEEEISEEEGDAEEVDEDDGDEDIDELDVDSDIDGRTDVCDEELNDDSENEVSDEEDNFKREQF